MSILIEIPVLFAIKLVLSLFKVGIGASPLASYGHSFAIFTKTWLQ
jgi:hypothetical protein